MTLLYSFIISRDFGNVLKLYRFWEGVDFMLWGYILENNNSEKMRDNQSLFQLIEQLEIADDNLYFDMDGKEQTELNKLLKDIQLEDRLVIRSVLDLSDSMDELIKILKLLSEKKISLCSCEEPFLSGEDYADNLNSYLKLHKQFIEKKKQKAYQKAVAEGRVGRPVKESDIKKAIDLYKSNNFTVEQIKAVTGISRTTLYRYINKEE